MMADTTPMLELLRTFMVGFGWPVLFFASIFILAKSIQFYKAVKESPFGKLVLASVAGWLITMYGLGVVATFYLFSDVSAVHVVFPIFLSWFATLVIILHVTLRWSKEATTLHVFYRGLEAEVQRRTKDIEEAHKREDENQKQIQKLKDEFLFIAAHELRSPVNAIKWGLQTILEDESLTAHFSSEAKEILRNTYARNERLKNLVASLLDTARLEQGTLTIKSERVQALRVIRETLDEVAHLCKQYGVRIINNVENPPVIIADTTLLKEIFTNLITNAIRYNVANGTITITEHHNREVAYFVVHDTGQGIPKDQITGVFDKFHHIEHKHIPKTGDKSVGLGLYITKQLVTRMGGEITVTSALAKGSTFTFSIPRDTS